jgi:hypothetical protein
MTDSVPSKEMVLAIDRVCRGVGNFSEREQVRKEIIRLREDLQRAESARVAILAENTHYKQRVAELEKDLVPKVCCGDFDNCTGRCIPLVRELRRRASAQPPGDGWDANGSPVKG